MDKPWDSLIIEQMRKAISKLTREEAMDRLIKHRVPCAPYQTTEEFMETEHAKGSGLRDDFQDDKFGSVRCCGTLFCHLSYLCAYVAFMSKVPLLGSLQTI